MLSQEATNGTFCSSNKLKGKRLKQRKQLSYIYHHSLLYFLFYQQTSHNSILSYFT